MDENFNENNGYQNNDYQNNNDYNNNQYNQNQYNQNYQNNNDRKPKKNHTLRTILIIIGGVLMLALIACGIAFGVKSAFNTSSDETTAESTEESEGNTKVDSTTTGNYSTGTGDLSDLVENVMPSLVSIANSSTVDSQSIYNFFYGSGNSSSQTTTSLGSGVIVGQNDTELLICTNAHVIEDADTITITFTDDATATAYVKGYDSEVDVAVVAVKLSDMSSDTLSAIKIATFGDSDSIKIGESVAAIGNADGIGLSVTTGIVSAINRTISTSSAGLIQTDAAINPGNSGGALFNMKGEVIGITNSKLVSTNLEGMGFAIPSSVVEPLCEEYMNAVAREKVAEDEQGMLGIQGQSVSVNVSDGTTKTGIYITSIYDGSGVDKAGIPLQSVILSIDGKSVTSISECQNVLQYYKAGETVIVKCLVVEGSEYVEKSYDVTLSSESDLSGSSSSSGISGIGGSSNGNSGSNSDGNSSNGFGSFYNFGN